MSSSLYVQYGCGLCTPNNWQNFDASPNLWLERFPVFGRLYAGKKSLGTKRIRQRFPSNTAILLKGYLLRKTLVVEFTPVMF
jgi:hypothetical protein